MDHKKRSEAIIEGAEFSEKMLPNGRRYDFGSMEIGQGIFCATLSEAKSVVSSAYFYAKKNPGFKMSRRYVHGGYKVWRVS